MVQGRGRHERRQQVDGPGQLAGGQRVCSRTCHKRRLLHHSCWLGDTLLLCRPACTGGEGMQREWRGCVDQRGAAGAAEPPSPASTGLSFAAPGSCTDCCCGASRACWAALDERESAGERRRRPTCPPAPPSRLPASSLPPRPTAALKRCIRPPPACSASCSGPPTPALPSSRSMGAGGGSAVAMVVTTSSQGSMKAEAGETRQDGSADRPPRHRPSWGDGVQQHSQCSCSVVRLQLW